MCLYRSCGTPKGAGVAADGFNRILHGLLVGNVRPEIPMSTLILEIGQKRGA